MPLPNPIIDGYPYNWYELVVKLDALDLEGFTAISGSKQKAEQVAQYGRKRKPIAIATGKIEYDPITVTFYFYEWQKVKSYLMAKSLGFGYALVDFSFTVIAAGNPAAGAPPVGDIWGSCKITEVGKEYEPDANGTKVDVTFLPNDYTDVDDAAMVTVEV